MPTVRSDVRAMRLYTLQPSPDCRFYLCKNSKKKSYLPALPHINNVSDGKKIKLVRFEPWSTCVMPETFRLIFSPSLSGGEKWPLPLLRSCRHRDKPVTLWPSAALSTPSAQTLWHRSSSAHLLASAAAPSHTPTRSTRHSSLWVGRCCRCIPKSYTS